MNFRSRCFTVICASSLAFACLAAGLFGQDVDPLKAVIAEAGDKEKYPGAGTVLLFDRTLSDVQDTGLTYVTQERLWKVMTVSGGLSLRTVVLSYDPQSGHVEFKEARIYKKDGTVRELSLDPVQDYTAPARAIYWGMREAMLPVGRLEPGDALYVKNFRKGFTYALLGEGEDDRFIPPMRGHFYDIVEFFASSHVLEKSYTALLPKDKPLQYEIYNGTVTSSIRFKEGKTEYQWIKRNIKPRKSESNQVAASDVECKLLMSTSPDWFAKSAWFHKVNEDYGSFEVTPEIQAKVDELCKDAANDEEKISILTHWVADDMRYSGISMGEGEGFTLHTGEMNFHDRCGVCKDKAGMLITMLRAAGFKSYPAMTMAGSRIDYIPADQFNHCVTLVEFEGNLRNSPGYGKYKLLDPTWVPFNRELWSSAEQQQNYLPGTPEPADLKETQISAPENHYFRITGASKLHGDGTLEGEFTLTAEGQNDGGLRSSLIRRRQKAMWHEYFDEMIHRLSARGELVELEYGDPYDLTDPMEIKVKYRMPAYALVVGDKIIFTPCVASYPFSDRASYLRMNLDLKDRKHNFKDRTSQLIELSETITLPEGYKVSHLPEYKDAPGKVASFKGGYTEKEGALVYDVRLSLGKRIYTPVDYPEFCKAVKGMKHMMENSILLSR